MKICGFFLLLFISFNAFSENLADKIRTQNSEQLDRIAKQIADNVASELPIRVNKNAVVTSIVYVKNSKTFMYFYELVDSENLLLMKKDSVAWACSDPIMSAFMDKGIRYKYVYANQEKKQIGSYYVTNQDC